MFKDGQHKKEVRGDVWMDRLERKRKKEEAVERNKFCTDGIWGRGGEREKKIRGRAGMWTRLFEQQRFFPALR